MTANKNNSYTDAVIQAHDLEAQWSPQVIAETKKLTRPTGDQFKEQCLDFTDLPFVTIDGDDARDYDDAICARNTDDGRLLQIAIADVSHYVRPGTMLDKAARSRGNSAYFVDRVIPM
ncbi:MAG: RNB domain-containing ribonuclease, partial [Pseudomonadales bacterium]|nr:RNB domain-containing ribonuclease [Pseudomonadales bacterium]